MDRSRRLLRRSGILASIMILLLAAGCSGAPASSAGEIILRFNWWGSDSRHEMTREIISLFEREHPRITVAPEYSNYYDYFDKLATSAASGDLPDVVQVLDPYMYAYIENGQLLDLRQVADALATDDISETALSAATVDGGLYAIPGGLSSFGLFADPAIFAKAGVPSPRDTTWSWDEYLRTAVAISEALPDIAGTQLTFDEQVLTVWLRQHGEDLWNEDGSDIGFTADTVASYWEYLCALRDSGGTPSVEEAVEATSGGGIEQSPIALRKGAMQIASVNQVGDLEAAVGHEVRILRFPGERQAETPGTVVKPGIYYSIASESEHPEEAAMLIDFLVNSPEAAKIQKLDRGVPANERVLRSIAGELSSSERRFAAYVNRVEDVQRPFGRANADAGLVLSDAVSRLTQDVLFDRATPSEAAEQLVAELKAEI